MFNYLKDVNVDLRIDGPLVAACAAEIAKGGACGPPAFTTNRTVLACLRDEAKAKELSDGCKDKVFHRQKLEAEDARLNVGIDEDCKEELAHHCKDVQPGGGRLEQCLFLAMTKAGQDGAGGETTAPPFSEPCKKSVLALKVEQASDVRLKPLVWKACKGSIQHYCTDIQGGNGPHGNHEAVLECLATKGVEHQFGKDGKKCSKVVHEMVMEWATDFRLSPLLRPAAAWPAARSPQHGVSSGHVSW